MTQRIREAEHELKRGVRRPRGDVVTGMIQTDARYTLLDLGRVVLLPQAGIAVRTPRLERRIKAYIVEVRKTAKGPQIVVSRTHGSGQASLRARGPRNRRRHRGDQGLCPRTGHRTKIAVWSNDANVDPVGACVGARGARVRQVVNELRGEKIDIVPFHEDLQEFVTALSPAKVTGCVPTRSPATAMSSYPTSSSRWRSARKARTPALPPVSPAGESTSSPRPSSPRSRRTPRGSSGPMASGSRIGENLWQPADGSDPISEADYLAMQEEEVAAATRLL